MKPSRDARNALYSRLAQAVHWRTPYEKDGLHAAAKGSKITRMRRLTSLLCSLGVLLSIQLGAPARSSAAPSPAAVDVPAAPAAGTPATEPAPAATTPVRQHRNPLPNDPGVQADTPQDHVAVAVDDDIPEELRDRQDVDPRALNDFKEPLAAHGDWVADPTYGTIWVPRSAAVGPDFAPYVSGGHWSLTSRGQWVWVSDYPFGPVVFHYGRWVWTGAYGWGWIPGYRYADAWVTWRVPVGSYAYLGWAPLPPEYIWVNGDVVWLGTCPPPLYVFVWSHYAFSPYVHYYLLRHHYLDDAVRHTRRYHPAHPWQRGEPPPGRRPSDRGSFTPQGPPLSAARVPPSLAPNATLRAGPRGALLTPGRARQLGARPLTTRALRTPSSLHLGRGREVSPWNEARARHRTLAPGAWSRPRATPLRPAFVDRPVLPDRHTTTPVTPRAGATHRGSVRPVAPPPKSHPEARPRPPTARPPTARPPTARPPSVERIRPVTRARSSAPAVRPSSGSHIRPRSR